MASRMAPLLALLASASAADFHISLLLTENVRGAAFPVNGWGSESGRADYADDPCSCDGGAARRAAVLQAAQTADVVSIDRGGHFFGSGSFFPAFAGDASSEMFATCSYEAYGLSYRDFAAFANSSSDGAAALASYLDRAHALDATLPLPVVSNIDLEGTPLESRPLIIPKIEKPAALRNIDEILALSDG